MKNLKKLSKRGLALLLALVMCLGMANLTAFAAETPEHEHNADGWQCVYTEPVTEADCQHEHDESCYAPGESVLSCEEDHEHAEECYVPGEDVLACQHVCGEDCTTVVTEGCWTCTAPVVEETPAEVQAFLDAVAAIPAVTTGNAADVAGYVYGEVSEAYEALLGTEHEDRADVQEAVAAMAAAMDAVDAALGMGSTELASGYTPVESVGIYPDKKPSDFRNSTTANGKVRQSGQSLTMQVGQKASFLLGVPTNTLYCGSHGYVFATYNPSDYCDISLIDNSGQNLVGNPTYAAGSNNGNRVFDTVFEALKPGTSTDVRVCYYANFGIIFTNGASSITQYCPYGRHFVRIDKDETWYRYNDVFGITVNARYQLNYDSQGGSAVDSTYSDLAVTSTSLNVTNVKPTRSGFKFLGWAETSNAKTAQYTGGEAISLTWSEGYGSTANPVSKTLYAVWEEDSNVTYTVIYTDGVAGEVVFDDQSYAGLKAGDTTPGFVGTPKRDGYTFMGWSPAVNPVVADDDANKDGEIIYIATWEKVPEPTTPTDGVTVTKTPSEENPDVGEEFKYTILVTNSNNTPITVTVTDRLPDTLNFSKVSQSDKGVYNEATRTVTWSNVIVPANGSKELYVWVRANTAGEITNEAKAEWDGGSASGNTTVTAGDPEEPTPPVPEKPAAPSDTELKNLKLGVEIRCDVPGSGHAATLYYLKVSNYFCTVSEVTANTGDNANQYPYVCTVSINTTQQNTWLTQKMQDNKTLWNAEHKLLDDAQGLSVTLYWDGTQWTLPNGVEVSTVPGWDTWHCLVIHTTHKPSEPEWTVNWMKGYETEGEDFWETIPDTVPVKTETINSTTVPTVPENDYPTDATMQGLRDDSKFVGWGEPVVDEVNRVITITAKWETTVNINVNVYKSVNGVASSALKDDFQMDITVTDPVTGAQLATGTITKSALSTNIEFNYVVEHGYKITAVESNYEIDGYTFVGSATKESVTEAEPTPAYSEGKITANAGTCTFINTYTKDEPVRTPKIVVEKDNGGIQVDPETGNAYVNYTVEITNKSGFAIYGLRLTDTMTPNPAASNDGVTYSFRNWKVDGESIEPISGTATDMEHVLQLLAREETFANEQTVTLTYTVDIVNHSAAKVDVELYNVAVGASWSKAPKDKANFRIMLLADDAANDDEPDVTDSDSSTVSGSTGGSGTVGTLPAKYTLIYEWIGLPENHGQTLPTEERTVNNGGMPAGAHFTVDTTYTKDMEITVGEDTYVFLGWTVPDDINTESEGDYAGQYVMPERNVVITGEWTKKTVTSPEPEQVTITLTYDANGGSNAPAADSQTVNQGDNATFTVKGQENMTRNGYTFQGWATSANGAVTYPAASTITIDKDTTLYAVWTQNPVTPDPTPVDPTPSTYAVRYSWTGLPASSSERVPNVRRYVAGASVTVDTVYTEGTEVTVGETTYVFSGWDTEDFRMPARDVTITGTWTEKAEESAQPTNPTDPTEPTDPAGPSTDPSEEIPDENPPLTDLPDEEIPDEQPPLTDLPDEEIPDEEPPLANLPEEPTEDIPDEEPPLANVPKTGDTVSLWLAAMGISALGLLALSKRKEDEEA